MSSFPKQLRFCMITTFYPPWSFGGDAIYVWQLSNELARRGHSVTVIHCIDSYRMLSGREPENFFDNHPNVEVCGLTSKYGFLSPLATQQTGHPFFKSGRIKEILNKGFDVIHFHNISLIGGPKVIEYGEGIKLYTTHEYWLVCPTHVLMRFGRAPCVKPYCIPCQLVQKRPPQLWRYAGIMEKSLNLLDAIISPTMFSKKLHENKGLRVPIYHIPNFIPEDNYLTDQSGGYDIDLPKEPYFLYAGRIEKLKGVHNLIPVFRNYKKARLVIAGKGEYDCHLRRLAEGSPNIDIIGYVPPGKLRDLYKNASALIVPSINYEISPLVVFEAFREKTPVIVNNIGGLPEVIDESGGGFVYNSGHELVSAMDRLIEEPSLREELGIKGHESYTRKWSAESHLKSYFDLIESIER